ncbi:MAG: EVE domain-containing protein [Thermoplasmata archaeon]|nr:EVE domain-containing protein [Thermoplasmata archaeon]
MKEATGYWIIITSRGYWSKLKDMGVWGFSEKDKARLDTIKSGDKALIYMTADGGKYKSAIGGVVKFIGKPWKVDGGKNLFDAMYPNRIKTKVSQVIEPPLEFSQYVGKVSFVGKGKNWGSGLQGQPVKPITEEDYAFLMKEIERETK